MAEAKYLEVLDSGVTEWNRWRANEPNLTPDLSNVDFRNRNLRGADFGRLNLRRADFSSQITHHGNRMIRTTCLRNANFSDASARQADFYLADLRGACFRNAKLQSTTLMDADLRKADFTGADLSGANLWFSDLRGAVFKDTNMMGSLLVRCQVQGAVFDNCQILGISAWDMYGTPAIEKDLSMRSLSGAKITTDSLEIAHFLYILLYNEKLRKLIETVNSKVVLILGSFSPERKAILSCIKDCIAGFGLVPIIFDWTKPKTQDVNETIMLLAQMASFVVADITEPGSVSQELQLIVPNVHKPIVPLLLKGRHAYGMFSGLMKYPWLLPICEYDDAADILRLFDRQLLSEILRLKL
jgi:uncharacterized protein YjbI with pentapeptide repeats